MCALFLVSFAACAKQPAQPAAAPVPAASVPVAPPEPAPETTASETQPPEPETPPAPEKLDCERASVTQPVMLDPTRYLNRHGSAARRFSDIPTTKEAPLEECLVRGSVEALLRLRCDDGSNPFATPQAAHQSRAGNVGPGGRCDSIVDVYKVPCPEKTYDVYIDMYNCPQKSTAS
jgi:hypothetical protein